jgi:hypothetical protein
MQENATYPPARGDFYHGLLDGKDDGGVWDASAQWPDVPKSGDWVLYPPVLGTALATSHAARP